METKQKKNMKILLIDGLKEPHDIQTLSLIQQLQGETTIESMVQVTITTLYQQYLQSL